MRLISIENELTGGAYRVTVAGPGSFVFVPRGVKHTARITKPAAY